MVFVQVMVLLYNPNIGAFHCNLWLFSIVKRKSCLVPYSIMEKKCTIVKICLFINSHFFPVFTITVALPFTLPDRYFLKYFFMSLSPKPLSWERNTTTASLDTNDIALWFLPSSYVTLSVMFLILKHWRALCRQWNNSTGMFCWISHLYRVLMLGFPVSRSFIFCNQNLLSVL